MCGIVAGISKKNIINLLLENLTRLEYRGYDSSGIAVIDQTGNMQVIKELGQINNLINKVNKLEISSNVGISHSRWATHGKPTLLNAHPHISEHISVVHNGIIENYQDIKTQLIELGYKFITDTDTEVIAHLIHYEKKQSNDILKALQSAVAKLRGSYAIIALDAEMPDKLIGARLGSPLVLGLGENENFVASDIVALSGISNKFIYLEEGDIVEITKDQITILDKLGLKVQRNIKAVNYDYNPREKGLYDHYMQKEIFEQPIVIRNTLKDRLTLDNTINFNEFDKEAEDMLSKAEHIKIVACGTSFNAGLVAKNWFERFLSIPCDVEIASEYRYRKQVVCKNTIIITISQSGETADTLAALRVSKNNNYLTSIAICNSEHSTLVREAEFSLMTNAEVEIGVASTKAFTTQLTVLLLLVGYFSKIKKLSKDIEYDLAKVIRILPNRIEAMLEKDLEIKNLSNNFVKNQHALFLGRGDMVPIALEGSLKLKEISYIHAESYPAGEIKHGPLALVDNNMPIVIIAPNNNLLEKLKSNIEEVHARGGILYIFADDKINFHTTENINIIKLPYVEDIISPICYIIPLQLFAYHVSLAKGTNVDQPRNLAKSVTVE